MSESTIRLDSLVRQKASCRSARYANTHAIYAECGVFAADADTIAAFAAMLKIAGPPDYRTSRGGHWIFWTDKPLPVKGRVSWGGIDWMLGNHAWVAVPPTIKDGQSRSWRDNHTGCVAVAGESVINKLWSDYQSWCSAKALRA